MEKSSDNLIEIDFLRRKYKSNIPKSFLYYFLLGIHTVRGVMIPYFTVWGKLTFFELMILQSYFMMVIFLLEIPSGAIADFLGRNKALSLSALSLTFAALFYSIIPNFFLFALAETFWALGMALMSGTDEAFMYSTLKTQGKEKELTKYMARNRTMFLIAGIISAPLGSIIAEVISLQFTMTFLGFMYGLAFIVSLSFKEPKLKNNNSYKSERYWPIIKEGFKELKKNKILRILCFDRLFIGILIFLLFWLYQVYLEELNVPIIFFGFIASAISIINIVFMNILPMILKKAENKLRVLILVDIICGIAYLLVGLTFNAILGILLIFIIVATGYPRFLLYMNGINKLVKSENRATVLSTVNMFGSLLRALIFPFIGIIVMWNIFAIFIIIGCLIILFTIFTRVKSDYL
ncbi:MAG: MFS transporter [Promethearchaeota archaeon]